MDDKALFTILRCAENTDGQVGRSGFLKIMLDRESRKLAKLKLDHLEEYGSLSFIEIAAGYSLIYGGEECRSSLSP